MLSRIMKECQKINELAPSRTDTRENAGVGPCVDTRFPVSMTVSTTVDTSAKVAAAKGGVAKGGVRIGAGSKPFPAAQKMIGHKINALPADWEFLGLFIDSAVAEEERTPGHLVRAAVEWLRLLSPKGPFVFGHEADPSKARSPRLTPAVARDAARRGISRSELLNMAYAALLEKESKE